MPYLYTTLAMLAFAANSILCRLALLGGDIDASSFTALRLGSGALTLAALMWYRSGQLTTTRPDTLSVFMLFAYAVCFSFSYINIGAGSGALVLFASVQLTMIGYGLWGGERPGAIAWAGIAMAVGGLGYLLLPGAAAPPLVSALLMAAAGAAWGIYSLRGRGASAPLYSTGWNFIGTLPLVAVLLMLSIGHIEISASGALIAVASGSLASALGYVIWYAALPSLSATAAATVQLTVPVIAAFGGILLLGEQLSPRLVLASIAVLGGVFLTLRK